MTLLYLDFDGPLPPKLLPWITQCCKLWRWPLEAVRYDRTKRGWHVIIGVRRRVPFAHVVAAQAIFGSDPKRESFNLMRSQAVRAGRVSSFWARRANVLYGQHSRAVKISNT